MTVVSGWLGCFNVQGRRKTKWKTKVVKQQLNSLLAGGLLTASEPKQSGPSGKANKPSSKVQKQAKKERLRQKRKRVTADAAAAVSTEDAQTLRERNLQYYVETAKADANVQKLMRELLGAQQAIAAEPEGSDDEDLADLFG